MGMTRFLLSGGQIPFLVVVLDIFLRRIVGWHLSHRCRTQEWLAALDLAPEVKLVIYGPGRQEIDSVLINEHVQYRGILRCLGESYGHYFK